MEEEGELITDLSFGSQSSTPKCKTSENRLPITPSTAYRIIDSLGQKVDELMDFRQIEAEVGFKPQNEVDSLKLALKDANILICDSRNEISGLKIENAQLKDDIRQEKEGLAQQQKEYELKLFRIQKELDNKTIEIVDLRKDKSEFDYTMKLLESRHARKIEELTQALEDARGTNLNVEFNKQELDVVKSLTTEIEEGKAAIDNLKELLSIQTTRADMLSAAFADTIDSWTQVATEIDEVLTSCAVHDCLTFDESELPKIDDLTAWPKLSFTDFDIGIPSKPLSEDEINELIAPAKDAVLGAMAWARSLLNQWSNDLHADEDFEKRIEELTSEKEQVDRDLEIAKQSLLKTEADYSKLLTGYEELNKKLQTTPVSDVKNIHSFEGDNFDNSLKMVNGTSDEVQIKNESGMTTYLSAAEEFVETVLNQENSKSLEDFAKEFSDYLVENQVFHPEDVPPTDTSVFYFVLDRYMLLAESYHNAKADFEQKLAELVEEHEAVAMKTDALISQLEVSDSTLCDTSATASSVDFDQDVYSSTMCDNLVDASICATMIADASRDPLEITMDKAKCTPDQRKALRGLQTPQSRIPVGRAVSSTKLNFTPSTPRIEEEPITQNPPSIIKTPLHRLLSRDVTSTAKKSVTFKSPLLVRAEIELENARLKALVDEKLNAIRAMEDLVQTRVDCVAQLQERVEQLESTAAEASKFLERAETEFSEKRDALEKELAQVSLQLSELTNKLVVEAINLDPSLETRLRNQAPAYVLSVLLDTIITRFQKTQDEEKQAFEKERKEWSAEILKTAITTESLQMTIDQLMGEVKELTKDAERRQLEHAGFEDKITGLEEDVLRLATDNQQLERDNAQLNKEYQDIKLKMDNAQENCAKVIESDKEIESLKLALEATETEKNTLKSENAEKNSKLSQLEQDLMVLKTEFGQMEAIKTELETTLKQAQDLVDEIRRKVLGGENNHPSTILEKIQFVKNLVEKRVEFLNNENKILNNMSRIHEAELSAMAQEMISVKAALLKTEEKIVELENEVKSLEDAKNELKQESLKLRDEISASKDEAILRLKQEAIEYESTKIELSNLKSKFEENFAEKLSIIEKLEAELQSSLAKITEKEILINQLEGKLSQLKEENDKEIISREQTVDELKNEHENLLRHEIDAKNEEIALIKREFSTVIDGLNASINEKVAFLEEMNLTVAHLKLEAEKQASSQTNFDSLREEVNALAQQLNDALKEKSDVANNLAAVEVQLADALSRYHVLESELKSLRTELIGKSESLDALTTSNNELAEKLLNTEQALTAVNEELTGEKSAAAEKLSEVGNNLQRVEGLVADLEAANEQLRTNNTALSEKFEKEKQDNVSALKTELDSLNSELKEKLELINSLIAAKNELQDKLSSTVQAMTEEKTAMDGKLLEIEVAYNSAKSDLERVTQGLTDSEASNEKLKAEIVALDEQSKKEKHDLMSKLDMSSEVDSLRRELNDKQELINSLTASKNDLAEKLSELEKTFAATTEELNAEKSASAGKLSEMEEAFKREETEKQDLLLKVDALKTEQDTLRSELTENLQLVESLTSTKTELAGKLWETEQDLLATKNELVAKKTVLAEKLSEIEQAYNSAKTDLQRMERMLADLESSNEKLRLENSSLVEKFENEKQDLMSRLDDANALISELENQLGQFKLTEGAILRKLADKQASDETAMRLRAELAELKASWEKQQDELDDLRQELQKKSEMFEQTESSSSKELANLEQKIRNLSDHNDALNTSLEKNRDAVKDLETQINVRSGAISDLNRKVDELTTNNSELCSVLEEIQKALRLPTESVQNLTMDSKTKSYLRMFRENVNRELNGLWTEREAMINEQQRLTIEVEKLTSEKVHFEIKAAELDAFGKSQEEQIQALSGKLMRLEASMSRRQRRSDPIGPRRLEKLEEMNKTLHDLIMGLINAMDMPNAEKMRLISQREVDAAAKHILDHAAKIAAAANSYNTLKEQVKTLDQENQELSDSMEKLLKDNNRLEMKVIEIQKSSSKVCAVCADLKQSLKEKTDSLTKLEAEVHELKINIKELDQENEELSDNVEALLKDNSKLEMQIFEAGKNNSSKDCGLCKNMKEKLSSYESELESLKLKSNEHAVELEKDLEMLRKKCEDLETSLKDKEQQLLRAVNNLTRPDEIRMRGSSCGLTQEISQSEKIRSLTKDNTLLKELLRQRAQTIKKLETELKNVDKKSADEQVVMNSNSMDSPIREKKSTGLRTRGDVAAAYKRALRPGKSLGFENIC